jgi:isopentenyl-diphosphate Delta-isomerase
MTETRTVILCDANGQPTGLGDLLSAHTGEGQLHLAFSVYVFTPDHKKLLLQQRSAEKRLWPLSWANTCCSHPRESEKAIDAGQRRLWEELGLTCHLRLGPGFVYRAEDPAGRGVEHEYDILLIGTATSDPIPNAAEVAAWQWADVESLTQDMQEQSEKYAPWLHLGLPKVLGFLARVHS